MISSFHLLLAASCLDAGCWHLSPGRASAHACLSHLMQSLLRAAPLISQKMPSSSSSLPCVLVALAAAAAVQLTAGLGEEPELPSDRAGLGQSRAGCPQELCQWPPEPVSVQQAVEVSQEPVEALPK